MFLRHGLASVNGIVSPLIVCFGFGGWLCGAVSAATLRVPQDFVDIQSAVMASVDGDEVTVADGTYHGSGNKNIDFAGKNIAVRSVNGPAACIIDLEDDGRAFYLHSGEGVATIIEGFTITNGRITSPAVAGGPFGAGIHIAAASPTIRNCVFVNNAILSDGEKGGGAIYTTGGSTAIVNCTFSNNAVDGARSSSLAGSPLHGGGAIMIHQAASTVVENCQFNSNMTSGSGGAMSVDSNASIINCTFAGNMAHDGGAMLIQSSSPTVENCAFENNASTVLGGAIYHDHGSPEIRLCSFVSNTSQGGGAIESFAGNLKLRHCMLVGNQGTSGGALRTYQGFSTVINCEFAGNKSTGEGGAMRVYLGFSTVTNCTMAGNDAAFGGAISAGEFGKPELVNCVLWENTAATGPQLAMEIGSRGSQIKVHHSNVQGGEKGVFVGPGKLVWGAGNIDADPLFVEPMGPDNDPLTLADNNYRIAAGSPCIDAGDSASCPFDLYLDLDNKPRFYDDPATSDSGKASGGAPVVDLGAFEYQGIIGDINQDGVVNTDDLMLVVLHWGPCQTPDCDADVTGDGVIDCNDLLAVINNWS